MVILAASCGLNKLGEVTRHLVKQLSILQLLLLELVRVNVSCCQALLIGEPEVPVVHVYLEWQYTYNIGTLECRVNLVIDQERGRWRQLKVGSGVRKRLLKFIWRIAWEKFLSQETIVHCEI